MKELSKDKMQSKDTACVRKKGRMKRKKEKKTMKARKEGPVEETMILDDCFYTVVNDLTTGFNHFRIAGRERCVGERSCGHIGFKNVWKWVAYGPETHESC